MLDEGGAPDCPPASACRAFFLRRRGLHGGLGFRAVDPVGAASPSRLRDALLESALAVLQDCEGSVAAVGGADNIGACAKEIGLMKGGRAETFRKGGEAPTRSLAPDRKAPTPTARPRPRPAGRR